MKSAAWRMPRQNPEMMTMAGKIPAFSRSPDRDKGSRRRLRFTAMRSMALWGSVMWTSSRVRAVPCLHLSRAGVDASNCLNGRRLSEKKYGIILWNRPSQAKKLTRFDTTLTGCFERDISRVGHRHFK